MIAAIVLRKDPRPLGLPYLSQTDDFELSGIPCLVLVHKFGLFVL